MIGVQSAKVQEKTGGVTKAIKFPILFPQLPNVSLDSVGKKKDVKDLGGRVRNHNLSDFQSMAGKSLMFAVGKMRNRYQLVATDYRFMLKLNVFVWRQ